jgi:hypothetical protein
MSSIECTMTPVGRNGKARRGIDTRIGTHCAAFVALLTHSHRPDAAEIPKIEEIV